MISTITTKQTPFQKKVVGVKPFDYSLLALLLVLGLFTVACEKSNWDDKRVKETVTKVAGDEGGTKEVSVLRYPEKSFYPGQMISDYEEGTLYYLGCHGATTYFKVVKNTGSVHKHVQLEIRVSLILGGSITIDSLGRRYSVREDHSLPGCVLIRRTK